MGTTTRFLLSCGILAALVLLIWIPAVSADDDNDMPGPIDTVNVGGGKGWIDTYCNVDGASVYFDGTYKGKIAGGLLSVGVSPTGTPVKTIKVTKSGYSSWAGSPPYMPGDGGHVSVYATLNRVTTSPTKRPVDTGSIYARSSPSGASIYANGVFYGYSPLTITDLEPGSYSMKAVLSGYSADAQIVNVHEGQTSSYYPTLQPSPPSPRDTGMVSIRSSPSGAAVYVDGDYRGTTPLSVSLYTGSHDVTLRLSGYSDWTSTVYVTAGGSQTLYPSLSTAISGMLTIGLAPAGSQVYLDSNLVGVTNSAGAFTISSVTSGNHIVKVTAQGYNDWIETVYIKPNTNNYVQVSMTPSGSSPAGALGTVQIVSSPSSAEVYIDNVFRGYSPVTLTQIGAGQHTLTLKLSGYTDYVSTISITAGQTLPVAVTLTPAPTPTPESPLSPIVTVGGIAVIAALCCFSVRRI
ncbi:MAG TPA: PEGA domain-containing protein [Methanoregulaceae archaeon]|nr:PEGA domain-containing protein [Methanoregulaceae archaeon]HPD75069.1 PEGA domain-containing protein [Methanoregulaceae archaeon]HRY75389.1 PEGA domain-containing protein [Methanoregulaceae archaeon]